MMQFMKQYHRGITAKLLNNKITLDRIKKMCNNISASDFTDKEKQLILKAMQLSEYEFFESVDDDCLTDNEKLYYNTRRKVEQWTKNDQ